MAKLKDKYEKSGPNFEVGDLVGKTNLRGKFNKILLLIASKNPSKFELNDDTVLSG